MRIRNWKKASLLTLVTMTLIFSPVQNSLGQSTTDYSTQLQENLRQQQELKSKIDEAVKKERDLSSQISLMDNQIKLTLLKIDEAETSIQKLGIEIENLNDRLGKLQTLVEELTENSNQRVRNIYQQNFVNPMAEIILSTKDADSMISRYYYLQKIRQNDIRILEQLQATKNNYNSQKELLASKKDQQEKLRQNSLREKQNLDTQKREKDDLLKITKNSETNYQALLAQLKAEYDVIRNALSNRGIRIGKVNKGEVIATIGSGLIGCSTGPHVHFELVVSGSSTDPKPKLDSGELAKTTDNYPGNVHQWFGENPNRYFYGPRGHTGIDMGSAGDLVYAADAGEASYVVDQAPCVPGGQPGRAITIDHGNGFKTLYLHVK